MDELAERLLRTIRKQGLMHAGDRVAAAVSGGADSVALLLLLLELRAEMGIVLSVAHVNHKLRGEESEEDERFVTSLAEKHGLELMKRSLPVGRGEGGGIEDAARKLRYDFFGELAGEGRLTTVATAHTLDDQAETVLLRIFRGTGIRGLRGILPRRRLEKEGRTAREAAGEVVRPLLGFRRAELREDLRARGQSWREDSSNEDTTFLRNRLRLRLMPMIASDFGDAAMERIAELAEIVRAEEEQYSVPSTQYPVASIQNAQRTHGALQVEQLLALPLAAARRVVRAWLETEAPEAGISFRLIEDILELARGPAGKELTLPGNAGAMVLRRGRDELSLETADGDARDYEYVLAVPGEIFVAELGMRLVAEVVDVDGAPTVEAPTEDREMLLDAARLGGTLTIRNWRAGDRFWPTHTRQEKKVKEILSDKHVIGREKKLWPVAECGGELVWMRGCAVPTAWQARSGKGIRIREIALAH